MTAQLVCVPPWRVLDTWPYVSSMIRAAVDKGRNGSVDDIERGVCAGIDLLWVGLIDGKCRGAVVTGLRTFGARKVCVILAFAGPGLLRHVRKLRVVERWARKEGCSSVRIYGRRGWQRVLRDYRPIPDDDGIEKAL